MLVVFLDVEDNCACQLHLGQQVEVSQDEEYLALRFKMCYHEFLEGEQVILLLLISLILVASIWPVVQDFIFAILSIPKRENIIPALNHEHREVKICQLKIDISDLADGLLGLRGDALGLIVELLARASLVDGHLELTTIAPARCWVTQAAWLLLRCLVLLLLNCVYHN